MRHFYNETLTYDENGNIATLQRNNLIGAASTLVDNLTYTYKNASKDNQLDNVTDAVASNTTGYGWRNYTGSTGVYTYDDNGNLLTDPKKGTTLTYNELDKTTLIQKTATKKIEYKYDAAGVRLTKIVTNGAVVKTTQYIGGFVTENSSLIYYAAVEGRVRSDAGVLKHEYMITDWQGNVRLSFEDNGSGTAITRQESSFYAFGMQIAGGYTPPSNTNKFLYNAGSELQDDIEEGMADYYSTFFREYDAVLGRFNGVDMAAVQLHDFSVYQYSFSNPVNFNDPFGDLPRDRLQSPPSYRYTTEMMQREMMIDYFMWHSRYRSMWDWTGFGFGDEGGGGGGPRGGGSGSRNSLKSSPTGLNGGFSVYNNSNKPIRLMGSFYHKSSDGKHTGEEQIGDGSVILQPGQALEGFRKVTKIFNEIIDEVYDGNIIDIKRNEIVKKNVGVYDVDAIDIIADQTFEDANGETYTDENTADYSDSRGSVPGEIKLQAGWGSALDSKINNGKPASGVQLAKIEVYTNGNGNLQIKVSGGGFLWSYKPTVFFGNKIK